MRHVSSFPVCSVPVSRGPISFRPFHLFVFAALASSALPSALAEQPVITLARPAASPSVAHSAALPGASEEEQASRANYREFAHATIGREGSPEVFTLEFHAATMLTQVAATGDFHVSGGSCSEGRVYNEGQSCSVEVAFAPKAPGHRTGLLSVSHTAAAKPMLTPIGGTGSAPAVQFTPSVITTVSGTLSGSTGTLLSPSQLAVDGGDNLYIPDAGNHLIKRRDSSGGISTIIGGGTNSLTTDSGFGTTIELNTPSSVAVDYSGTLYFGDSGDKLVGIYYLDTIVARSIGLGSTNAGICGTNSKCVPSNVAIQSPESLAVDPSGNVYLSLLYGGDLPGASLAEWTLTPLPYEFFIVGSPDYNYYSASFPISTDPFGYGNLYYTYDDPGGPILSPTPLCYILAQNYAFSNNLAGNRFWTVAGAGKCGFSGDGGKATGAEIGKIQGQFAWDPAGNFYFTDTSNNRVRRVDGLTGIIHTLAGSGINGIGGDGGPSTAAQLTSPFGLAVDSTGKVYVTGVAASGSPVAPNVPSDIRAFGTVGALTFAGQAQSTHSAAQTVMISNVGNINLNFTHTGFASGNTSDFAVDPNTTTCNFALPLASGHNCLLGFIFTPSALGTRTAVYSLDDDTANGLDTIQLAGTGGTTVTLAPSTMAFPSTTVGALSTPIIAKLTNTGSSTLTISTAPALSGINASSFKSATSCGATLAAGANCSITITFAPTVAGSLSATLTVIDNASTQTQTIALTGKAVAAAKASLTPASPIAFSTQTVAKASAAKVLTLANTGGVSMSVTSYTISGTNAADFTQTHTCGPTVAAAASCGISVTFKPSATGTRTATLTVVTTGGTVKATLSGSGAAAAVKTRVTLSSGKNPVVPGQTITLTSSVVNMSAGSAPTGTVKLIDGNRALAETELAHGVASFKVSSLSTGFHSLTAEYLGDGHHTAATSDTVLQRVAGPLEPPSKLTLP